ncbi:AraC family transcriptional regulator [Luteibacter rhizovicinus]|uniref:AraC family transcriptional regulator n=1 Tax=Luteibacter rhizovicinus TaxID=242606 RepID=A0A4R3YYV1_9GAMM|nr:helix-turn-helix transcriptional regulator [Luteibacter rhizovicinus]TCV97058.1 AraC family transcriptional regulator [Luteibacter rhizovicinus]
MRNTRVDLYEDTPRDVVATGNEYPDGGSLPPHSHRRGQLLYASNGVVAVFTQQGSWLVPPRRALWIPAGVQHEVRMNGDVSTRSAYVRDDAATAAGLPAHCRVIAVSPLLHALLTEAVDLPACYDLDGRGGQIMRLLLSEVATMPALPLNAPLPVDARLARLCRTLLEHPQREDDLDTMASRIGMSRRHFTRLFRSETGMSFTAWRQQASLMTALTRLGQGESVTRVAADLGYASSSAFTAAFKKILGAPPSRYFL